MKDRYSLENLEKIFKEHDKRYVMEEKKRCKEQPCVYIEAFRITKALYHICKEINRLKHEN